MISVLKWLDGIPDWTLNTEHSTYRFDCRFYRSYFFCLFFVDLGLFDAQCSMLNAHTFRLWIVNCVLNTIRFFHFSKENIWMEMYHRVPMFAFMCNCAMHTKICGNNLKILLFCFLHHRNRYPTENWLNKEDKSEI